MTGHHLFSHRAPGWNAIQTGPESPACAATSRAAAGYSCHPLEVAMNGNSKMWKDRQIPVHRVSFRTGVGRKCHEGRSSLAGSSNPTNLPVGKPTHEGALRASPLRSRTNRSVPFAAFGSRWRPQQSGQAPPASSFERDNAVYAGIALQKRDEFRIQPPVDLGLWTVI